MLLLYFRSIITDIVVSQSKILAGQSKISARSSCPVKITSECQSKKVVRHNAKSNTNFPVLYGYFQSIPLWIFLSIVRFYLLIITYSVDNRKKNMLARKIIAKLAKSPKQAFSTYKTSTGLVGLAVDLDGRQNLINVSAQILDAVQVRVQWQFCESLSPYHSVRQISLVNFTLHLSNGLTNEKRYVTLNLIENPGE